MSAAPESARAVLAPRPVARPPAAPGRAEAPGLARRLGARLGNEWLPRAAWTISRTGRSGLLGIALLLAAALFLVSTHLEVAGDVEGLRADLAQRPARTAAADKSADPATAMRSLPARSDMPAILRQLFDKATQARLAIDVGKYEVEAASGSGVVRHRITFPVTGPYPQIRAFIDAALTRMPAVALSDIVLDRKSIADGNVDAQIRMTVYTVGTGGRGLPGAGSATAMPGQKASPRAVATEARQASARAVAPTHAPALFAQHSWFVLPPAQKPPPPPPPPEPTAPPLPFTYLGSLAPQGAPPVFFLAHGDRMIDARVGDRLEGVYQFESAASGQLVFVYLPLNVRQTLAAGASR